MLTGQNHPANFAKTLGTTLLLPVALALFLSAAGIVGVGILFSQQKQMSAQLNEILDMVERFRVEAETVHTALYGAWLTDDDQFVQDYQSALYRIRRLGPQLEEKLRKSPIAGALEQLEVAIRTGRTFVEESERELALRGVRPKSREEFRRHVLFIREEIRPKQRTAQAELDKFAEIVARDHASAEAKMANYVVAASYGVFAINFLALLALGLLSWRASRIYLTYTKQLQTSNEQKKASVALLTRANTELARTSAELKRSNEALDHFTSIAAHDIKEPLRTISTYLSLLDEKLAGRLEKEEAELLDFAVRGGTRLNQLLGSMLEYSRMTMKSQELASVSTQQVLDQVLENLRMTIQENEARIQSDPLPEVLANPQQLCQIFQNLIANAIKYRGDLPPEIRISCESNGENWKFSVRDNGIGFESSQAERIFQLFHRAHPTPSPGGSGIGLAICRKLIERQGGKIWAESEPGRGAVFHFILKKADANFHGEAFSMRPSPEAFLA